MTRGGTTSPPTRLILPGAGGAVGGRVKLADGVGTAWRLDSLGQLILDGLKPDLSQPGAFFLPGALGVTASAVTFDQRAASNAARLLTLEVNCGTATSGDTGAGAHYSLVFTGAGGGSMSLALAVAATRHFSFSTLDPVSVGVQTNGTEAIGTGDLAPHSGVLQPFTPTADLVLTGASIAWLLKAVNTGQVRHMGILDEHRTTILAQSAPSADPGEPDSTIGVYADTFLSSVTVLQGVKYWVAFWTETQPVVIPFFGAPDSIRNVVGDLTLPDPGDVILLDGGVGPLSALGAGATDLPAWNAGFGIAGNAGPVTLTGAINVAVSETGAPSAPPADLNVRMVWAA
jgi:hypothetical protein